MKPTDNTKLHRISLRQKHVASMLKSGPPYPNLKQFFPALNKANEVYLRFHLHWDSFYQKTGLKFEEETSKMLHLEHGFVWC